MIIAVQQEKKYEEPGIEEQQQSVDHRSPTTGKGIKV